MTPSPSIDPQKKNLKNKQQQISGGNIGGTQSKVQLLEVEEDDPPTIKGEDVCKEGVAEEVKGDTDGQTPNLSQGSEFMTDSTLSSLSLASVSSQPHTLHTSPLTPHTLNSSPLTTAQQPETGQAPYTESASPLTKRTRHTKHTLTAKRDDSTRNHGSGIHGNGPDNIPPTPPVSDRTPRSANPAPFSISHGSPQKGKRARSLSPNATRRIFTSPQNPEINVRHHDENQSASTILSPSAIDRFAHLDLVRTESPDSVKSDTVVVATVSSRKPLRSSLRGAKEREKEKEKNDSSSSVESGKQFGGKKITISPRSSQVVYLPDDTRLESAATFSQPTILSPARSVRERPSSVGDHYHIGDLVSLEQPRRRVSLHSTVSEKLDYTDEENFLSHQLMRGGIASRYDSTPEVRV